MSKQRYPTGHAKFHQNGWVEVSTKTQVKTTPWLGRLFWAVVVLTALFEIIARGGLL